MSQGPSLLFDKSTLESLSLNEAVLLDNFYRSTITPLFFVECLADLEREMFRMRGTPEQLVGSLAERTPDCQSAANVHHMEILKGELSAQFSMDTVLLRPFVSGGKVVELGDSKGMLFQPSEEEEAVQRWACHDFLGLERQIAKRWRNMIERIDLQAMSAAVRRAIGPWRKPVSLQDARTMTDTIIDNLEPEWLLRFGLELLGVPETTEYVVADWKSNRKKPLRTYRPYFIHMLSINIFFSLVLPTQLLSKVKASHQIDLAYLYYLPFCAIFSSRDNFHVQVAPLFMHPSQQFVHGDDLKTDLKRLDELYLQLSPETREKGLSSFAQFPPDDSSFLTTRLWDAYLPDWRKGSKNVVDVPRTARAEAFIASRVPDIRFLLDYLLTEAQVKLAPVGIAGHSFGGWTALASPDVVREIRAVVALAPGGSSNPRPGILRAKLAFNWGRDVPTLVLVADGDVCLPINGMYEIFERIPAAKRMIVLRRADHMHFMDNVEQLHEAIRTSPPPIPELDYLQKEMRPIAELCTGEQSHLFVRGLTVAHFDAVLKQNDDAHRLLAGDMQSELTSRGIDAFVHTD